MTIQNLNNNFILLPVKDCRGVSLISYTDGSNSLRYASRQVVVNRMCLLMIANWGNPIEPELK